MKLSALLGGLHHPTPATRLDVVRVLAMLDETRALAPLRERYNLETDESVREAITWAGKRLFLADQAGYSTIDEIFKHFNLDGAAQANATPPTDADFAEWLPRLSEAQDESIRKQAIIQLADLNNPRALPRLAATFVNDPSPEIRQAAQHYGKLLYWRSVYWTMEQDGSLATEKQRRTAAIYKLIEAEAVAPDPATPEAGPRPLPTTPKRVASRSGQPNVADILKKAEAGRVKRQTQERQLETKRHRPSSRRRKKDDETS